MFPIRCFTCGKVIKWEPYAERLKNGQGPDKALDSMGMRRACCRRMFKSHNPQIGEDLLMYSTVPKSGDPKVFLEPDE